MSSKRISSERCYRKDNLLLYRGSFKLRKSENEKQKEIRLKYKGKAVGLHRIDFLVSDEVIVEIKAVENINKIFEAQLLTYLKAMDKKIGLLINFNVLRLKEGIKRLIL